MKQIYLHALGQNPDSWSKVIEQLEAVEHSMCPDLSKLVQDQDTTYQNLYAAFSAMCDAIEEDICLEDFLPQVSITPALVQNEIHPYYQEREDVEYCHVTEDTLFTEMEKFEAGSQNDINVPNGVKVV